MAHVAPPKFLCEKQNLSVKAILGVATAMYLFEKAQSVQANRHRLHSHALPRRGHQVQVRAGGCGWCSLRKRANSGAQQNQ
jgi:hypothetical protein